LSSNNVGRSCFGFRQVQVAFQQCLTGILQYGDMLAAPSKASVGRGEEKKEREGQEGERGLSSGVELEGGSILGIAVFGAHHHRDVVNLTCQTWCPFEVPPASCEVSGAPEAEVPPAVDGREPPPPPPMWVPAPAPTPTPPQGGGPAPSQQPTSLAAPRPRRASFTHLGPPPPRAFEEGGVAYVAKGKERARGERFQRDREGADRDRDREGRAGARQNGGASHGRALGRQYQATSTSTSTSPSRRASGHARRGMTPSASEEDMRQKLSQGEEERERKEREFAEMVKKLGPDEFQECYADAKKRVESRGDGPIAEGTGPTGPGQGRVCSRP
jgi:hypothetical protein